MNFMKGRVTLTPESRLRAFNQPSPPLPGFALSLPFNNNCPEKQNILVLRPHISTNLGYKNSNPSPVTPLHIKG
jgi:hypothetical protein